jgi:hypothetical protein
MLIISPDFLKFSPSFSKTSANLWKLSPNILNSNALNCQRYCPNQAYAIGGTIIAIQFGPIMDWHFLSNSDYWFKMSMISWTKANYWPFFCSMNKESVCCHFFKVANKEDHWDRKFCSDEEGHSIKTLKQKKGTGWSEMFREATCFNPVSSNSSQKYTELLCKEVAEDQRNIHPKKFGIISDGWSECNDYLLAKTTLQMEPITN